jgi:uncharacterized protein YeaO (DUF488 family)
MSRRRQNYEYGSVMSPAKFTEFSARYREELAGNEAVAELIKLAKTHKQLTLIYGAKDPEINHAIILLDFLKKTR